MPAPRRPAVAVLAILLVVWEPAAFAFYASAIADRIVDRGHTAIFLLVVKMAVLGMGIAAGRALWRMGPGSVRFAQVALALSAATTLAIAASDAWPPRAPGTVAPLTALVILYDVAWIGYLQSIERR